MKKGVLELPYTYDGKSFFAVPENTVKEQSVTAVMSFPESVAGELISRHSPRDGKRGIELGLAGDRFYALDGNFLSLVASNGTRKHILNVTSGLKFKPGKDEKYLLALSYIPQKVVEAYVVRMRDRHCVYYAKLPAAKIPQLTADAGCRYLAFGGRLISAGKKVEFEYPVSAGTKIYSFAKYGTALRRGDIEKMLGGKMSFPEIEGDDLTPHKAGDTWCEARRYIDKVSGLPVMQLTTKGIYNQGPTVHYGTAFPGGKDEISFSSIRDGVSYLMTGNIKTGELKVHYVGPKIPDHRFYRTAADVFGGGVVSILHGINTASSLHHRNTAFYVPQQPDFRMINLDTGKITTLIPKKLYPDFYFTTPVFSGDGKTAAVCGKKIGSPREGKMHYFSVDLATGKISTAYEVNYGQTHFFSNPVYPDIWIVKQFKPAFRESDPVKRDKIRRSTDCYFVDIKTKKTRPLLPRNTQKNITHLEWTGDGKYIVYHGTAYTGGTFVGAMDKNGKVVWEYVDPAWHQNRNGLSHICADSKDHYIIDDGLMVPEQISLLDWKNSGKDGRPLVIPLAQWKNQWIPGQFGHPHPAVSPDGNYVVFYGCRGGNTHIYVIDISSVRKRLSE